MVDETANQRLSILLKDGFRYAMSLTHDLMKAEDILQDAWLAVLKAKGPHEKAYLFRAIRSRFINEYRRELLVPIEAIEADVLDAQASNHPANLAQQNIALDELAQELGKLRPAERETLYLSAVEGYTAQEISDFTKQPRGSVLSLIYRAKKKLQESLDKKTSLMQSPRS